MPRRSGSKTSKTRTRRSGTQQDAIALLKADHREVAAWFEQFEKAKSASRKQDLAGKICKALKVHTQIEDEIFYPAFLEATEDEDMHHEAVIEHDTARKVIAEIEASRPSDEYYDAKVKVLSELIEHHVEEEEERGGMFAEARQSDMDLKALGQALAQRKAELMKEKTPKLTQGRVTRALRNAMGMGQAAR